jgi:hypothetical protein
MTMNFAASNTRSIKLVKQHSLAVFGGICLAFAAAAGGVIAVSQTGSGTTSTVAPRADYSWARGSADEWRTIYYVVPTQELGDQILREEMILQHTIMENGGQPPLRTIRVILVDTPEQEELISLMMGDALPDTTSFVDLRYPPIPAIGSPESAPLSQAAPVLDGEVLPAQSEPVPLYLQYCAERFNDVHLADLLEGLCN